MLNAEYILKINHDSDSYKSLPKRFVKIIDNIFATLSNNEGTLNDDIELFVYPNYIIVQSRYEEYPPSYGGNPTIQSLYDASGNPIVINRSNLLLTPYDESNIFAKNVNYNGELTHFRIIKNKPVNQLNFKDNSLRLSKDPDGNDLVYVVSTEGIAIYDPDTSNLSPFFSMISDETWKTKKQFIGYITVVRKKENDLGNVIERERHLACLLNRQGRVTTNIIDITDSEPKIYMGPLPEIIDLIGKIIDKEIEEKLNSNLVGHNKGLTLLKNSD